MSLIIKKNTTFKIPRTGIQAFLPSSLGGLSLWLKGDTGISLFSFDYKSQIIISGTSNPSFAGTYTYTGTPTYSEGSVDSYFFNDVPSGKEMSWSKDDGVFFLQQSGGNSLFQSSDGANWSAAVDPYISQVIITGFTGVYSGANGTYNVDAPDENSFTRVGGGFYIQGNGLYTDGDSILIATNNNNYQGAWTPATFVNQATLSGAGSSYVNGVYTRTSSGLFDDTAFSGPTSLTWTEGEWWLGAEAYASQNLINWYLFNTGEEQVPTSVVTTLPKPVGSPTSTTVSYPSGSISGSVTISTANTNDVTAWADQSGNGRNAVNADGGFPTPETIGGKSFLSFADGQAVMEGFRIWDEVPFVGTIFLVARFPSSVASGSELFLHNPSLRFGSGYGGEDGKFFVTTDDQNSNKSTTNLNINTTYLLESTFNTSTVLLYINGISDGSGITNGTDLGESNYRVGAGSDTSKIAEVVVYNRVLSTPERQQVEQYLNDKYQVY